MTAAPRLRYNLHSMTPRAVIFDLDGTLADTLACIAAAVNAGLAAVGLPERSLTDVRGMVGEGIATLCARALPPDRPDLGDALLEATRAAYDARPMHEVRLYPGMQEMLDLLRGSAAELAVLSNKPDHLTVATIDGLGIRGYFRCVLGHREEFPRKPDPKSARFVAAALGVEPGEVLYVGDTPIDMQTGRAAGFRVVAVSWGFRALAELLPFRPDHVVHDPRDVAALYRGR